MTGRLYGLGRFCVRHRFVVCGLWLVAAVALIAVSHTLGETTSEDLSLPGTDSQRASDTLARSFPNQANGSSPIVLHATHGKLSESRYAGAVDQAAAAVAKAPHVASVISPLTPQGASALINSGQDNRQSVVSGLVTSARVITSAAFIMVFVFGSFVLNGDPTIKQFGVGLAVAVILDATVVRCLLVPALMLLMGRVNWWMPGWLGRVVPHTSIEGAEFFHARDTAVQAELATETPAAASPAHR